MFQKKKRILALCVSSVMAALLIPTVAINVNADEGSVYTSSCQIISQDAVSGSPIEGAVYQIAYLGNVDSANQQASASAGAYAYGAGNAPYTMIGNIATNKNGEINLSGLAKGWYAAQETHVPYGYEMDTAAHNFQITGNGLMTLLRLTNQPILGRIALKKLSADYNKNTGWDYDRPLEGAVYDVVDTMGAVVDTITTGGDGTATTKPIKIGEYSLIEVKAPDWYGINPEPVKAAIQSQGQTVSVVSKSNSIKLGVSVLNVADAKTVNWNDAVNYYITGIQNTSNVFLDNFIVHDKLPDPKAATIQYFDTGLWSQLYRFTFSYATNMNTEYTTLPGTYSANEHHQINLAADNLGLRKGEFVTQVKMTFEEAVKPGFKLLEAISIKETVTSGRGTGYQFTNYADVTGRWMEQTISANSHWTIEIIHR